MQIPIMSGVYTNNVSDIRTSYPRNMIPVPKDNGISQGYLRPAYGIKALGTGTGVDRGGIAWNGACYRVMGGRLIRINDDFGYDDLGYIPGSGQVTMDYSFDRLAISGGGYLYYYDGATLTQVTDADLGTVNDFVWIDGYFMTTDGTSLIVTELNDPYSVNPLKYGSSESDPDPIVALLKLRNEVYALNRNTIEIFQNVGGDLFPFQRVDGAQMQRGCVGTFACSVFMEQIAWLGGGRNEQPAIWMGSNSQTEKISTREVEQILALFTETQLSSTVMEVRVADGHQFLYVHLPDRCLVFDGAATQAAQTPVWHVLDSSLLGYSEYRGKNFVYCYNKWLCADPTSSTYGYLTAEVSTHYGNRIGWDFGTTIIYNEGRGAIFNELELVCLTGRAAVGDDPTIWTSYSLDGMDWSQERPRTAGMTGQRMKRISWLRQGHMRHWRIQRFRGTSDAHMAIARLEATLEPLND